MKKREKLVLAKETIVNLVAVRAGEDPGTAPCPPSNSYYCTEWYPCGGGGGSQPIGSGVACGTGYSCYLH